MKLTKENIYVPVVNKKEAKRFKACLKALGEKISDSYWIEENPATDHVELVFHEGEWVVAINWHRTKVTFKVTFKQAIEIILSESKPAEKIAVRVDNEKEFDALMKYYDSLGWKSYSKSNPLSDFLLENYYNKGFNLISFFDGFVFPNKITTATKDINDEDYSLFNSDFYKIIPFSDFSKEHGIEMDEFTINENGAIFKGDVLIATVHHRDYVDKVFDFIKEG